MKKFKQSTVVPLLLGIYLAVMVCLFGLDHYRAGNYTFFFGIIGVTAVIIILLHFLLKRKEKLRREREDDIAANSK